MLYLEDYLEIIENLPQELRDRFTEMRELDLLVNNEKDKHEERQQLFFSQRTADLPEDIQRQEYLQLRQDFEKIIEYSFEKFSIAIQLGELIDKYYRRLEMDLQKFKLELEADNAGITERLEKRISESDNVVSTNYSRGEKRKHASLMTLNTGCGKYNNNNDKTTMNDQRSLNGYNVAKQNRNTMANVSTTQQSSFDNNCLSNWNTTKSSDKSSGNNFNTKINLSGPSAIAAIASQAIVQTSQSNTVGRKTASLKASYEAINSNTGLSNFYQFNANRSNDEERNGGGGGGMGDQSGPIDRLKRSRIKRNRTSNQFNNNNLDASNNSSDPGSSDAANADYNNMNEPRYCYCDSVSYGEMIFCENKECPYQWFHYECVGIKVPPDGSWFCPTCLKDVKERYRKDTIAN
ncbi:inhibitor of growth protein 3 [Dermatophagoides farinae]|uniref:Inhibitor of growth protein n=1 Tax=Dermatophagoides farinae TaxID=6954 RepID=A0A922LAT5_DERFA|nr:inhibitor of growth protein 3-like [Dermatophagoides farinae]KAH7641272.1 ing3 [Dermatophagoides farinae]KAH9527022.1 Inhibitor of growth protein 3 [Dermatophagoides farinae]